MFSELRLSGCKKLVLIGISLLVATTTSDAQEQALSEAFMPSRPSLNFYGLPGAIDMPSAEAMPDGQIAIGISSFSGINHYSASFQFSPRISGTFRYGSIDNAYRGGYKKYYDRSFDFRYLLFKEKEVQPAITIGLQDFSGTGVYSAEYLVATKNFTQPLTLPGIVKVTAGLGWGRLGSKGSIGSPFGDDRSTDQKKLGGSPTYDQWFRGPMAPFGAIEWQISDQLGFKAEYSSDAYVFETQQRDVFDRKSQFSFGAEYQLKNGLRVGGYYLYGSKFGVNAQIQLNPNRPSIPFNIAGPRPVILRPSRTNSPESYGTSWAQLEDAPSDIQKVIGAELEDTGIKIEAVSVSPTRVELRVHSDKLTNQAIVFGRVARSMARILPDSVETFDIILMNNSLAMSKVSIPRTAIETQEFVPNASNALLSYANIGDAAPNAPENAFITPNRFPRFSWSIGPYVRTSFFDPDRPIRADVGIEVSALYRFAPGWVVGGEARQRIWGNIGDSRRTSNSVLPHVRTDAVLYAREGDTTLENLYINKQWKPSADTFARITAGYLEQMYGGLSTELLWKPADSPLGLGIEANYVKKRDFNQRFGFQDYDVFTGHASAYYNVGNNYVAEVDAGRYLAGDYGATFSLTREFANGWKIGGFFTLTDVSSEDFGEGSFDKGITFSAPVSWFTGSPGKTTFGQTIRPTQRDGGQRVTVPGRLYNQVLSGQENSLIADWGRVWE